MASSSVKVKRGFQKMAFILWLYARHTCVVVCTRDGKIYLGMCGRKDDGVYRDTLFCLLEMINFPKNGGYGYRK